MAERARLLPLALFLAMMPVILRDALRAGR